MIISFSMVVKKFKEYISEGMWKSGLDRAKSNTTRIEDRIVSNIKDMNEIDLHYFKIADVDLELNGKEDITWKEIYNSYNQILEMGWRLPTQDEIELIMDKFEVFAKSDEDDNGKELYLRLKQNPEFLTFKLCTLNSDMKNFGARYWFIPKGKEMEENYYFSPKRIWDIHTFHRFGVIHNVYIRNHENVDNLICKVRLVKND